MATGAWSHVLSSLAPAQGLLGALRAVMSSGHPGSRGPTFVGDD